jgi:iron complex transport system permease protein
MLLGESEARHLGIDVDRIKWALIIWVAVGVGACVALAGTIAFVGLVVPHIVRLLIGPDHRALIPACALAGASLLLLADTLARTLMAPAELPVGVVTALVGVPFFISLLRGRHRYGMH